MSFTGIAAAQSFAPAVNYNVGSGPEAVTVGDLNRDGRPDLAVANSGSGNVSVLLGNGDGTFQASVDYPTNPAPTEFAVGNFNGDGLPDLVVANLTPDQELSSVQRAFGNGDGTFRPKVDSESGPRVRSMAVADLNGDGITDLATIHLGGASVGVHISNGDGTFRVGGYYSALGDTRSLAVRDFDLDGRTDLAVTYDRSDTDSAYVGVLLGNGDGTFRPAVGYLAGIGFWYELTTGDFNADSKIDLATTTGPGSVRVSVLLNQSL